MKQITFITNGYDGFIDFIKAYAIICVLIAHCFPWYNRIAGCLWMDMQVPLFILVQVFHCYKKSYPRFDLVQSLKRVILPFLVFQFVVLVFVLLREHDSSLVLQHFFSGGGYGPGAYYPWVYLQIGLLLPLFYVILKRFNPSTSLIIFLSLCELFEVLFSFIHMPGWLYRLLAVRYLFLIYLGWIWVNKGVVVNWKSIILSVASALTIIYFEYFSVSDEPWFFSTSWKYHRWPCYFFVANGFIVLLHFIWNILKCNKLLLRIIKLLASASYEIFLIQMVLIFLVNNNCFAFIPNRVLSYVVWVVFIGLFSLIGGVFLRTNFFSSK